jgi:hypothetical protein
MDGFSFHFFIAFFAPFFPRRSRTEEMNAGARSEMEIVVGRGIYGGKKVFVQLLVAWKVFFLPSPSRMNSDEKHRARAEKNL